MLLSFIFLIGVTWTGALQPYDKFREGSCSKFPTLPVKARREFVDSLKFVSAGNKYHLYRSASALHEYKDMREDEFYYNMCLTRNTSTIPNTIAANFGFGRLLNTYRVSSRPGIYGEFTSTNPVKAWDSLTLTVTLTDHKSFAFFTACWNGVDQRAWSVATSGPNLDKRAIKQIEEHAEEIGFKRENFVFLRYDSCKIGPIFEEGQGHGWGQIGVESKPVELRRPELLLGRRKHESNVVGGGGFPTLI